LLKMHKPNVKVKSKDDFQGEFVLEPLKGFWPYPGEFHKESPSLLHRRCGDNPDKGGKHHA